MPLEGIINDVQAARLPRRLLFSPSRHGNCHAISLLCHGPDIRLVTRMFAKHSTECLQRLVKYVVCDLNVGPVSRVEFRAGNQPRSVREKRYEHVKRAWFQIDWLVVHEQTM